MPTKSWSPHPRSRASDLLLQAPQDVGVDEMVDGACDEFVVYAALVVKKGDKHDAAL